MKYIIFPLIVVTMLFGLSQTSEAQWIQREYRPVYRRVYRPVYRRYYRPVVTAPGPVTRVYRRPTVVYQPATRVYTRRRPILGGYVVRTRPTYQRTVIW